MVSLPPLGDGSQRNQNTKNMKKIIDKILFNTETAEEIHVESSLLPTDNHYLCETLYRTKNGALFLHGEGGCFSRYSETEGNACYPGEAIIPMSEDEAYDWLESVNAVKAIEIHFSDYVTEA